MFDSVYRHCFASLAMTVGELLNDLCVYQAGVIKYCFGHDMLFTISADQDETGKEAIKGIKREE